MKIFRKIWSLLSVKQRVILAALFGATLFNSVLEFFGIGLIMPMVTLIGNPDMIYKYPAVVSAMSFVGINDPRRALLIILAVFIFIFIFKSIYIIKLSQLQLRFTSNMQFDLSSRLLKAYLYSPWCFHLQRNTAELLNNTITQVGSLCTGLILSVFAVCTESCLVLGIVILLLIMDPVPVLIGMAFLVVSSVILLSFTHHRLKQLGNDNQFFYTEMIKSVNEALGGIKETKILGREEFFVNAFMEKSLRVVRSWVHSTLINTIQRSAIEIIFIVGIVAMSSAVLLQGHSGLALLSRLAVFIVASFRLMPSMHRINAAINSIKFYQPALDVVHRDINGWAINNKMDGSSFKQPVVNQFIFKDSIEFVNLSFRYPDTNKDVLSSVNISIPKGKSVGFVGRSGAGKTTAVDIILGLLQPSSGGVFVDKRNICDNLDAWRRHLGYIPQVIYLSDNSVRRNIAFGMEDNKIKDEKVWKALRDAQLYDFVKEMPQGLDTYVGERGIRLSGGQRQRIGIARAIYHNPDVLIMDEATSSLDNETEKEIAKSFFRLSGEKTLIIIAHRTTTIEKCDIIYEFKDGKVII